MQDRAEIVKALRGIDDAALLEEGADELEQRGDGALNGKHFDGLVIRAPARIDVRKHETLRALIAVEQTLKRAREVPLKENAVAVITRLGLGGCWFAEPYALPPEKEPLPPGDPERRPKPPLPPGANDARLQGIRCRDVRGEEMPWESGRYVVRVISAEWTSNAEIVTLTDESQAATQVPRRIKIESGDFAKGANHPVLKGPGAALSLPAKGSTAYGSVRLKRDAGWPVTEAGAAAIPVTILLKRNGILNPVLVELLAPATGGEEAEAWFTIDLRQAAPRVPPSESCWVYLIAGEFLDGPHSLESR